MTITTYYIETKDGGHEIPVTVTGRYVPREVRTMYSPQHDAHFEDVEIFIDLDDSSEGPRRILVSEAMLAPFTAEELLFEQEREDQTGPDPSDQYRAMRDEGHRI